MDDRHLHWRDAFSYHLGGLETFLLNRRGRRLNGETTVYLAGVVARESDQEYRRAVSVFRIDHPEELDLAVRRHDPYLGQNAPLVTLSRVNAERLTYELALDRGAAQLRRMLPGKYFGIAAYYSHMAGKRQLATLFDFFRNHLGLVIDVIAGYIDWLEREGYELDRLPSPELLKKFGAEINELNRRKEFWDAARIDTRRINRIAPYEARQMLDFERPN